MRMISRGLYLEKINIIEELNLFAPQYYLIKSCEYVITGCQEFTPFLGYRLLLTSTDVTGTKFKSGPS